MCFMLVSRTVFKLNIVKSVLFWSHFDAAEINLCSLGMTLHVLSIFYLFWFCFQISLAKTTIVKLSIHSVLFYS